MLQQSNVPGHQRGRNKTKDLPERKIPWHDGEHRTNRLEIDKPFSALCRDLSRRENRFSVLYIIEASRRALLCFSNRGLDGLAHLDCHEASEPFFSFDEELARPLHLLSSINE